MAPPFFEFKTMPTGSILILKEFERLPYIAGIVAIPNGLYETLSSRATGSYIRGLTRTFNLPLDQAPVIALQILTIGTGQKPMAQLAGLLSSSLKLANDKAQEMARDIEKEIFGPVMLDLNAFISKQKQRSSMEPGGAQNVINLKTTLPPKPPIFPAIPTPPRK